MRVDAERPTELRDLSPVPNTKRVVSLIIPVYSEEASIRPFMEACLVVLEQCSDDYDFEFIFVNDGSSDGTEREVLEFVEKYPNVSLINLSRNFGKEAALSAGLSYAKGAAVIPMDVDLQDPPELIPQMFAKWEAGAQIVNARRSERLNDTWFKRVSAGAFYRVFNLLADQPIPGNVGDYRLLDREVVKVLLEMGERARFNKALFSWVGFETDEVIYERPNREEGFSSWSYWKLWKLALDGIFSSSTTPLRIWTYLGATLAIIAFGYTIYLFLRTMVVGADTPGYASTAILILVFGGLNLFALGIIGEYVGRIYTEVRQRPLFVVKSVKGAVSDASVDQSKK